ncbi:MAG: urea ABC transporter permease subunit UrtB [Thiohalocapsa sp.]|uniref:urea ABC transporter permease subunit UrtB n=1 Tax=Thiohalocapsa sp. TaxID=2497641 RepID=UPI0025ED8B31|nr:urea ABC transporter permease subunit UrtB [Thiohalocapsa sp.]MCG6940345.1 urea ABC transporter permease subunit UrtB [Thiohalocapsa sp.]
MRHLRQPSFRLPPAPVRTAVRTGITALLILAMAAIGGTAWAQAGVDAGLDHDSGQGLAPVGAASSPRLGAGQGAARAEDGAPTTRADGVTIDAVVQPTAAEAEGLPAQPPVEQRPAAAQKAPAPPVQTAPTQPPSLETALPQLAERSFKVKEQAAQDVAASGDPRAADLLEALLGGKLYYRTDDKRIVLARRSGDGYTLTDALSGEDLGSAGRRDAKKIIINNRMRSRLRGDIAALTLASPDASVRLSAAKRMIDTKDAANIQALKTQFVVEENPQVRDAIGLGLAIAGLRADTPEERLAAVNDLKGSLYPEARNALDKLIRTEPDQTVLAAAQAARADIERRLENNRRLETLFFGLSLGSVLVLAAIGLAITFGVMGVINMAHGELIMLGAYTTYLVQLAMPNAIDYSLFVAIPAAFLVSGLFGVAIERGVIRFLYGRPLETLLATFGISLILQQFVRTTISAQNVVVENPSWMSGSLALNPALSLTYNRLYIFIFALLVFVALLLVLKRTALGLQVRAVSQNRAMARAMGVRSARVDALTFGLGAGIAGVAGVALSQLTNVGPNMGRAYIIDSFMVVVFGGVGNLWGTLVGGLTLGVANKFMEPSTGAVLAKILVLVFIILFIQWRPRGLFPQRGRAAEQ